MADGVSDPRPAPSASERSSATATPVRAAAAERAEGAEHRHAPPAASPHSARFRAVTGLLVGLAIAALIVAGAIATRGRSHAPAAAKWSLWSPPDSGTLAARDIADYIAPFYRLSNVTQLAVVTVVNLETAATQAAQAQAAAAGTASSAPSGTLQVAVRPSPTSSQVSLLTGNTIAYDLCGIGHNCAIGSGQPSSARLLLLRREALELALYTFKYLPSTQNVVAILPPGYTESTTTSTLSKTLPTSQSTAKTTPVDIAVLFDRQELSPLLDRPLADTLPEQFPPTVTQMPTAPSAPLVAQVTARGLFSEQREQAQDGSNLLVLNPLPPQ